MFFALIISVTNFCFAQNEVRGVETRLKVYNGSQYGYYGHYLWYGYAFTNMNSIPVSVDAELYRDTSYGNRLVETKTFVLESQETYIWKFEYNDDFQCIEGANNKQDFPGARNNSYTKYYVKYKAYKLE